MKKRKLFTLLTIFLLIPATLFLGTKLPGRAHYLTSTLIILEILIPFFLLFEKRKPQARELVVIAVMSALAFASRAAFAAVMYFKPISAIIMLSGIALGPEAGFVVGAISLFASNFLFGQGPWTPWQMMTKARLIPRLTSKRPKRWRPPSSRYASCAAAALSTFV